jgi:hypothetical protein
MLCHCASCLHLVPVKTETVYSGRKRSASLCNSRIASRGACRAIAMRDSDRDLTTKIIARVNSTLSTLADLKGKTLAVSASDSPQATLFRWGCWPSPVSIRGAIAA